MFLLGGMPSYMMPVLTSAGGVLVVTSASLFFYKLKKRRVSRRSNQLTEGSANSSAISVSLPSSSARGASGVNHPSVYPRNQSSLPISGTTLVTASRERGTRYFVFALLPCRFSLR